MNQWFDPPTAPCPGCNEEITNEHYAECSYCFRAFHMRMTESEKDAKDCGFVELNDEHGTMFVCLACWNEANSEESAEPVRRF